MYLLAAVVLIASGIGAGCRTQSAPPHPARWAKAWVNSLNSHRWEQVAPLLGARGTYQDPLTRGAYSGALLKHFLRASFKNYPLVRYEIHRVTGDDELVAVEWTATGLGAATASRPLSGVFMLHVRGDSIARARAYFDPRPLGWALPPRPAVTPAGPLTAPRK